MKRFSKIGFIVILLILAWPAVSHAGGPLSLQILKLKNRGNWSEVTIALENKSSRDLHLRCCTIYLENTSGYAVNSLTGDEVRTQIHNPAQEAGLIGSIVGIGLGLGGAISGKKELGYAGIATAGSGLIATVAGEAAANKKSRDLIIDDMARTQLFPAGLKVAGKVYFPPKKKWPGSSEARALHLVYRFEGKDHHLKALGGGT